MILRHTDLVSIFKTTKDSARVKFYSLKRQAGLSRDQYLSLGKFCELTGLNPEEVKNTLGWK